VNDVGLMGVKEVDSFDDVAFALIVDGIVGVEAKETR
jgi:hypothetical protein